MIDKFKRVHYFLKEAWAGFLHVAQLEDVTEKKRESPLKLFQMGVRNLIKGNLLKPAEDPAQQQLRGPNYNEEISKNIEIIKCHTIGYAEKILVFYTTVICFPLRFLTQPRN